jgi:hypothetical protein
MAATARVTAASVSEYSHSFPGGTSLGRIPIPAATPVPFDMTSRPSQGRGLRVRAGMGVTIIDAMRCTR